MSSSTMEFPRGTEMSGLEFNNDGQSELKVPGFGLPLDYWPKDEHWYDDKFPRPWHQHCLSPFKPPRMTVRELSMLRFVNAVTEKHQWSRKVYDEQIVARWRAESRADPLMSDAAFDWCMRELKEKANFYNEYGYVTVLDNHTVCVKSDNLVSTDLRQNLADIVQPLLDRKPRDWHPNSDEQILDLVHPSLFPLVYGRTRVLTSGVVGTQDCLSSVGAGVVIPAPEVKQSRDAIRHPHELKDEDVWSVRFQWLPCEVKFKDSGTEVKITSYINNLHPVNHGPLYTVIEQILSKCIKPWNDVLLRGSFGRRALRVCTFSDDTVDEDPPEWVRDFEDGEGKDPALHVDRVRAYLDRPSKLRDDGSNRLDEWLRSEFMAATTMDKRRDCIRMKQGLMRTVVHPEPGAMYSFEDWSGGKSLIIEDAGYGVPEVARFKSHTTCLEQEFRQRGLQVIVKLASIELTVEKPRYPGGNWHLEGMLNDHIVATAIYYYDVKNTTKSNIRFRQEAHLDDMITPFRSRDLGPLCAVFGARALNDEPAIQEIDMISTPEGRLIAFSNISQHRVEPFELEDPTKPGHRRFLVLWLVDPLLRVISTANVPPQQREWWADSTMKVADNRLPPELMHAALDNNSDWPMSLEEAKQLRLDLIAERTRSSAEIERMFETYDLCEH